MKKSLFLLILATLLLAAGCGKEETTPPEEATTNEVTTGAEEGARPETDGAEQDNDLKEDVCADVDDYMASVEEQSESIKTFLEQEAETQTEMNLKSQELYELWDDALNYLWAEVKCALPEDDFATLQEEQLIWIAEKEQAVDEAGKAVEGGSMYSLVVNREAARLTEERVYELLELLK